MENYILKFPFRSTLKSSVMVSTKHIEVHLSAFLCQLLLHPVSKTVQLSLHYVYWLFPSPHHLQHVSQLPQYFVMSPSLSPLSQAIFCHPDINYNVCQWSLTFHTATVWIISLVPMHF